MSPKTDPRCTRTEDLDRALASIRPAMQADGGDVEVVGVDEGIVSVRLTGTCVCCPSSSLTLRLGIERTLQGRLPWVASVVRVP